MKKIPFHLKMVQGAIGKKFVVKHYAYGVVMTKFPDMTGIIASPKQKVRRKLFKKAVAFAKDVYSNPARKETYRKILRRPKRLYQVLMKMWFKKNEEKKYRNGQRLERWKQNIIIPHTKTIISVESIVKSNKLTPDKLLLLSG